MKVNGHKIPTFELDTPQTIINRISAILNTTPKYLYFPNGEPKVDDKNVKVEDLLDTIKKYSLENGIDILFSDVTSKKPKFNQLNDILVPYIALSKSFQVDDDIAKTYLLLLESELSEKGVLKNVNINNIWKNRKLTRDKLIKEIESVKSSNDEDIARFEQFQATTNDIEYTNFELEKVIFEFDLNIKNISLAELFNHIVLIPGVPLASFSGIYKILKDFLPSNTEDWSKTSSEAILFKICQKIDISAAKYEDYTETVVIVDEGMVKVRMELNIGATGVYLSREKLIERFITVFHGIRDIRYSNLEENKVKGVFYIPHHSFDKYVFADITMNNTLFSEMASIDESEKASKRKNSVYWHFNHSSTGELSVNITGKISEKGDNVLRGKDIKTMFPYGSEYIRIKISSADNTTSVAEFQVLFSKLLAIYDTNFDTITEFYKKYIPDFGKKVVKKKTQQKQIKLKLKNIVPEVFVKGYPPKCTKHPTVIDDDQAKEAEAEGKIVMRYPKTSDEGFLPRNYICEHSKAKYPALRDNPLSNRELVPYLPCCYERDHSKKPGTIYRHYYFGEELLSKEGQQQELIVTNKFVPKDNFGVLPVEISKVFEVFDYSEKYKYVRKGVSDTMSSFLECVLEGMYDETGILDYTDEKERKKYLSIVRNKLSTDIFASACKQEMYDFSISDIKNIISDKTVYFDPKYFTSLLEEYFHCNIYVFTRNNKTSGELTLPRHDQGFYKRNTEYPSVFIYEHIGSTSDHAKVPRCELIVKWRVDKAEDLVYNFDYDTKISLGIRNIYSSINNTYALDRKIMLTKFNIPDDIEILEQGIDSYGKSRMVKIKHKEHVCTLLTTPVQPWLAKEAEKMYITKVSAKIAQIIAARLGIIITKQSKSNENMITEISGSNDHVYITIPVHESPIISGIPDYESTVSYPETTESILDQYNNLKKTARYVLEYTYWLFSRYIHGFKGEKNSMNNTDVSNFVKEYMIIEPNFKYPSIGKTFSIKSPILKNGKLIVKSEETQRRLVYALRVMIVRQKSKLLEYHTRTNIENYYVDVTDFDQYQTQVILQGEGSIDKWIIEQSHSNTIYRTILPESVQPYFFRNTLVSNNIYLAQNADTLGEAINVLKTWVFDHYNPRYNVDSENDIPQFVLYSYVSSSNIRKYKIGGKKSNIPIELIGYKNDKDQARYTVLLPLHM
jgi:hypothetical protein